jgi:hypothetical protein
MQNVYRIVLLFLMNFVIGLTLTTPLAAQTDIKIIVNGPWSYVADPADNQRVIIISPKTSHHLDVQIGPKPSANKNYLTPGLYRIEIANSFTCDSTTSAAFPYQLTNIGDSAIANAIASTGKRYAFSIPKPCYYSEKEFTFSNISASPIVSSGSTTKGDHYSRLMELHYTVKPAADSTLTGQSDNGTVYNDSIGFRGNAIWVSMQTDTFGGDTDLDCDSTSAISFLNSLSLFGAKRYVWFPWLDTYGNQAGNQGYYLDDCQMDNNQRDIQNNMRLASSALDDIENIEQYFRHPDESLRKKTEEALSRLTTMVKALQGATSLPRLPGILARPTIKDVTSEINFVTAKLLKNEKSIRTTDSHKIAPLNSQLSRPKVLLSKTYDYFLLSAAGSADCHGAQISVNGIVP